MGFLQDLRFATRVLWKKPGVTAIIVLTLALGIGAGSSMFSVVHKLLLRPLDLPDLDRLAAVQERSISGEWVDNLTPRVFLDLHEDARSFAQLGAFRWWTVAITGEDSHPEEAYAFQVSPGWFDMFGERPVLGRWFAADEVGGRNERVVVLGHGLWQRRYGGDRDIVGKTIALDGVSHTVVGVMPARFAVPPAADLWAPLTLTAEQRADRTARSLTLIGRLAPGVDRRQAHAEISQIGERLAALHPATSGGRALRVRSLTDSLSDDFTRDFIFILFGAALFVLLVACANVANVFLAHALSRRRELAVRAALGAGRGRIVRQLLTEAALLGLLGGGASLLVASWSLELLKSSIPRTTVRFIANWDAMGVDPIVLAFAAAVGLGVGLLFGVVPALQVSSTDVNSVLKEGERGGGGGRRAQRLRSALVVAQVALALIMLIGAGSMTLAFSRLFDHHARLDPEGVLTMRLNPPASRYPEPRHAHELARAAIERVSAAPGVEAAAASSNIPWGNNGWSRVIHIGHQPVDEQRPIIVHYRAVSPGYFRLLRVPFREGRDLSERDGADAPRVAIVGATTARQHWPGESAIGKRLRLGAKPGEPWITIVGVVPDLEVHVGEPGPRPFLYVPLTQSDATDFYLVARAADPAARARDVLAAVHAVDPLLPATWVRTLVDARAERFSGLRAGAGIMASFALLALVLAVVGIYGVIANLVSQRTHEIGVRMALGAQRRDVLRLVLRRGVALTAAGVAIGVALGWAMVKVFASVLVGLFGGGPALLAIFAAAVVVAALLGCWIPARRATRVDPMIALRAD
jgi:putative ABC transport system permease protein